MRKILLENITPDMKIIKTDKRWIKMSFLPNETTFDEKIEILKNYGVKEVYINPDKDNSSFKKVTDFLINLNNDTIESDNYYPTIEEVVQLQKLHDEAKKRTKTLLEEARVGNTVNTSAGMDIVEEFIKVCLKNSTLVASLSRLKDFDDYTFTHSLNVSVLCISLGKRLGMNTNELRELGIGALFHDLGKMKIPQSILNKPGKLTDEEFEIMKSHPQIGYEILKSDKNIPKNALYCVLQHHERADGSGYPNKLIENNISKLGKLTSIVDVYDAITSDRVYHKGMAPHDAVKFIFNWSEKHFNKILVKFFVNIIGIYPVGTLVLLNTGELAIVFEVNRKEPTRPKVIIISDKNKRKKIPNLFDLAKYNLLSKQYYKSILTPIDPRPYSINVNEYIKNFTKKALGVSK